MKQKKLEAWEKYLIAKAWEARRNGEFVDWDDIKDSI
jgi:hypothetical protein